MNMDKEEYFRRLYALRDVSDDETEDPVPASTSHSSPQYASVDASTPKVQRPPPILSHTASKPIILPQPQPIYRSYRGVQLQNDTSIISAQRIPASRTLSDLGPVRLMPPLSTIPSSSGQPKRKRAAERINMKPEAEQYLRGLVLFWVPPDDKTKPRRIRQQNAIEHGAILTFEWNADITHVVADSNSNFTLQQIMDYLSPRAVGHSTRVVDDKYLADCYEFRMLVNNNQQKYKLKGDQVITPSINPQETSQAPSAQSLQLKLPRNKPGKWDYVPPRATPNRSEESTQIAAVSPERTQPSTDAPSAKVGTLSFTGASTGQDARSNRSTFVMPQEPAMNPHPAATYDDELENIIRQQKEVSHLPLDSSDVEQSDNLDHAEDSGNDTDEPHPQKSAKNVRGATAASSWQANFSCMKGGNGDESSNPNNSTIKILQELAEYYVRSKDPNDRWRVLSYRKGIGALRQQTIRITTCDQAVKLPGIGESVGKKIEEIVATNRLRKLDNALDEPTDLVLKLFMNVYGVGSAQAGKWIAQGHTTLQDLLDNVQLSDNQRMGIEHFDDLNTRIPRAELTALGAMVTAGAKRIDPDVQIVIGGSYRRGTPSSGDIDCLVTKPGTTKSNEIFAFLMRLVNDLTSTGFLVKALAVPSGENGTKWHGCCILPGFIPPGKSREIWRRIDFLVVPAAEIGASLIYFTGNDIFNRSMRLLASKKKMRLNQRGLYEDVMTGPSREKVTQGVLVEGADERKIFEILGVPWREPRDRIC